MSQTNHTNGLDPTFHPVSNYNSPDAVLNDPWLSTDEKRVILSSWASDMYGVESQPSLREIPGIPHRLRLEDILSALKRLDDGDDPPPRGGLAMRLPCFENVDCIASNEPARFVSNARMAKRHRPKNASRALNPLRWTREANVRRYRKLLNTHLTDVEHNFIERQLAEELNG